MNIRLDRLEEFGTKILLEKLHYSEIAVRYILGHEIITHMVYSTEQGFRGRSRLLIHE